MRGPAQRCGQHHDKEQRQAEIPHLGAVVGYELYQAGDAQCARQHDILCKDGQHHIADKLHDTVKNLLRLNACGQHTGGAPPRVYSPKSYLKKV